MDKDSCSPQLASLIDSGAMRLKLLSFVAALLALCLPEPSHAQEDALPPFEIVSRHELSFLADGVAPADLSEEEPAQYEQIFIGPREGEFYVSSYLYSRDRDPGEVATAIKVEGDRVFSCLPGQNFFCPLDIKDENDMDVLNRPLQSLIFKSDEPSLGVQNNEVWPTINGSLISIQKESGRPALPSVESELVTKFDITTYGTHCGFQLETEADPNPSGTPTPTPVPISRLCNKSFDVVSAQTPQVPSLNVHLFSTNGLSLERDELFSERQASEANYNFYPNYGMELYVQSHSSSNGEASEVVETRRVFETEFLDDLLPTSIQSEEVVVASARLSEVNDGNAFAMVFSIGRFEGDPSCVSVPDSACSDQPSPSPSSSVSPSPSPTGAPTMFETPSPSPSPSMTPYQKSESCIDQYRGGLSSQRLLITDGGGFAETNPEPVSLLNPNALSVLEISSPHFALSKDGLRLAFVTRALLSGDDDNVADIYLAERETLADSFEINTSPLTSGDGRETSRFLADYLVNPNPEEFRDIRLGTEPIILGASDDLSYLLVSEEAPPQSVMRQIILADDPDLVTGSQVIANDVDYSLFRYSVSFDELEQSTREAVAVGNDGGALEPYEPTTGDGVCDINGFVCDPAIARANRFYRDILTRDEFPFHCSREIGTNVEPLPIPISPEYFAMSGDGQLIVFHWPASSLGDDTVIPRRGAGSPPNFDPGVNLFARSMPNPETGAEGRTVLLTQALDDDLDGSNNGEGYRPYGVAPLHLRQQEDGDIELSFVYGSQLGDQDRTYARPVYFRLARPTPTPETVKDQIDNVADDLDDVIDDEQSKPDIIQNPDRPKAKPVLEIPAAFFENLKETLERQGLELTTRARNRLDRFLAGIGNSSIKRLLTLSARGKRRKVKFQINVQILNDSNGKVLRGKSRKVRGQKQLNRYRLPKLRPGTYRARYRLRVIQNKKKKPKRSTTEYSQDSDSFTISR